MAARRVKEQAPIENLRVEMMDLDDILARAFPNNPKTHDGAALEESFGASGFVDPIILDETTGKNVAGHGRAEKLQEMRDAGEKPPARIEVRGKKWFVPVLRGVAFKDAAAASKYLLASNRIGELGGWDNRLLATMLAGYGDKLDGTGFGTDDVVKFMRLAKGDGAGDFLDQFGQRMSSGSDSLTPQDGYLTFALKLLPEQDKRLQAGIGRAKKRFKVKTNLDAILALCDSIKG